MNFYSVEQIEISIHAPTRGATSLYQNNLHPAKFQSTLPREERRGAAGQERTGETISIHAPTRGATVEQ